MGASQAVEGRWTIAVSGGEPVGQPSESEARRFGFEIVPVVPCDDAAVERAVQALIAEEGDGLTRLSEDGARRRVLAILRAAGAPS